MKKKVKTEIKMLPVKYEFTLIGGIQMNKLDILWDIVEEIEEILRKNKLSSRSSLILGDGKIETIVGKDI